jgi:hypothetical protein
MDAIPIPLRAAATNGQDTIVIFHRTKLDVIFVMFHNS